MQDVNKKAIKDALKNEVNPLLIGLRNELKGTNALLEKLQKEGSVNHHHINLKVNGKELPEITVKDGYTPQFGIDYFTDDHIASFVKASTPVKGTDYFTAKEVKDFIKKSTPKKNKDYFDGENGYTPVKGVDYFTKKEVKDFLKLVTPKKGKDYFDGKIGPKGADGLNGKNGTEISAQEIRNKLESLKGKDRLKIKAIAGLEEILTVLSNLSSGSGAYPADSGASLSPTGVTPGSYTSANITVNAYGQITSASNGSGGGGGGTWGSITGTLSAQTDLQTALNAKLSTVSVDGTTITGNGAGTPLSATQQISLLINGIPNASQTILNLSQGSGMTITDIGGGIIEFASVTTPAGAFGNIQYYDSVTGTIQGATGSFFDNTTGDYYLANLSGFMNSDVSKAVKYDAVNLSTVRTHTIPDADGTYVLSVNGTAPDAAGDVTISAGTPAGSNGQVQFNDSGAFGASGSFSWNNTDKILNIGNGTPTYTNVGASGGIISTQIGGNTFYVPFSAQNTSSGSTASTDFVLGNDITTDTTNYLDIGLNSSNNTDALYTLMGAGTAYWYNQSGNIVITTATAGKEIKIGVGGTLAANEVARFTSTGMSTGLAGTLTGNIKFVGLTSGTATLTTSAVAGTPTITLPIGTTTLLGNNLGLSGGTTLIGGTAAGDKLVFKATSNATNTIAYGEFNFYANNTGTTPIMAVGENAAGDTMVHFNVAVASMTTNNYNIRSSSVGGGVLYLNSVADTRLRAANADYIIMQAGAGTVSIRKPITTVMAAGTGAQLSVMTITPAAHTALKASTEYTDVNFALNRTIQFATGAKTLQRSFVVQAPTYSAVAASTFTDSATLAITGAPIGGTNATLTNSDALLIQAGALANTTNGYGLTVNAPTGATNNYAAQFLGGTTIFGAPVRLKGYTVATLPAGVQGDTAYVTDALAPVWGTAVAGGGAVVIKVFYDGTNWIVG